MLANVRALSNVSPPALFNASAASPHLASPSGLCARTAQDKCKKLVEAAKDRILEVLARFIDDINNTV